MSSPPGVTQAGVEKKPVRTPSMRAAVSSRIKRGAIVGACCVFVATCSSGAQTTTGGAPAPAAQAAAQTGSVTLVPAARLKPFLPDLPGWKKGAVKEETDTSEKVSRVQVDYEKGVSGLSIELMDSTKNPYVLAPMTDLIKANQTETRSDGFARPTMIDGFPGIEEWTSGVNNGTIHVLVAQRYMVKVTGDSVENLATITSAAKAIGLAKLATLR
jgi:hypothetical protein